MESECRAAFEKWFLGENPTITDKRALERSGAYSVYDLMTTRLNWIAWQAAWNTRTHSAETREAIEAAVEALELVLTTVGDCHDCWRLSASDDEQRRVSVILNSLKAFLGQQGKAGRDE